MASALKVGLQNSVRLRYRLLCTSFYSPLMQFMTIYSTPSSDSEQGRLLPLYCGHSRADHPDSKVFLRYHMGRFLRLIGSVLPQLLDGSDLACAARDIERMCWRELGYGKAPLFPGDVPPFLLHDENGCPTGEPLQEPMPPTELAARLAALEPSAQPGPSVLKSNFQTLARLLNLTPAESEWLLWSYCFTRFTPPTIALRSEDHAWSVLAEVLAVLPDEIRGHMSPHRLHVLGILEAPQLPANRGLELSDWLRCTPHFIDAVEAGHPSEAALWSALAPPATS